MNKGLQTFLGIVLFVLILVPVMGAINGYSEANAFNIGKVEIVQRVRETGDSPTVESYADDLGERFTDFDYNVVLVEDNDGDGEISYGDLIEVQIEAYGSGNLQFRKSSSQVEEEGRDPDDENANKPHFKYSTQLLVDRRDE